VGQGGASDGSQIGHPDPKPGQQQELAASWTHAVVAEISERPGNGGFVRVAHASGDRVVGLSLWDSAADAEAPGPLFRSHMAGVAEHQAGPPPPAMCGVMASSAPVLARP